jgi:hypothetical protein
VLKGDGMFLERAVEVSHGRVPGIAGLSEKAEIGEQELFHQTAEPGAFRLGSGLTVAGMCCQEGEKPEGSGGEKQIDG